MTQPLLTPAFGPHCVCLDLSVSGQAELFGALGRMLVPRQPAIADILRRRFERRHARSSVAIGGGVAVPRATLTHVTRPRAAYVRCRQPIPLDAPDGVPVVDVLALVVPHPGLTADLELLSRLEWALRTPALLSQLRALHEPEAAVAFLARAIDP